MYIFNFRERDRERQRGRERDGDRERQRDIKTDGETDREEGRERGRQEEEREKKPTIEPYTQMEAKISATRVRGQKKTATSIKGREGRVRVIGLALRVGSATRIVVHPHPPAAEGRRPETLLDVVPKG